MINEVFAYYWGPYSLLVLVGFVEPDVGAQCNVDGKEHEQDELVAPHKHLAPLPKALIQGAVGRVLQFLAHF